MPDGTHDRDKAGKDCPRHALVVKAPQVFQRAATAPDDEYVTLLARVRQRNGAHNLARRIVALHGGRVDDDGQGRVATLEDVQNIMQCRTGF
jgi:hypothetical protein